MKSSMQIIIKPLIYQSASVSRDLIGFNMIIPGFKVKYMHK